MVPPNWEHPKVERPNHRLGVMEMRYQPLYNRPFGPSMREWFAAWEAWERGERPDYCDGDDRNLQFWEWDGGPPDPAYYRPDWPEGHATWFQVYETVSEGTPVTPPFATREELVDYLVANGDFWDQKRRSEGRSSMRCTPWPRDEAEAFVNEGFACSLVVANGKVMSGTEALVAQK